MTAFKPKGMLVIRRVRMILSIAAFFLIATGNGIAQVKTDSIKENEDFEEISVIMYIPQMGVFDVPTYIRGQELFLPVIDIFTFLKIANTPTPSYDSINGFFINPEAVYLIDRPNSRIQYKGKTFYLKPGSLIRTENSLYLNSMYFGEVFGLNCSFEFHSLSVTIKTDLELPVIREMKQEQMRKNIRRIKGEMKADTTIGRNPPVFHFGMADWSINSTQEVGGKAFYRIDLGLGGNIAGGETNLLLNYTSTGKFTERQLSYYWHFVNNESKYLRQVTVGKIPVSTYSTLTGPLVGVSLSNTPTTYRRSFGSYILSDYTQPGWIVELYVKNILVDYVKADASGFFSFEVPLVYGNTAVKLVFYGPWGEERTRELDFNIPFNFLPPKDLEYTVSGGFVEDSKTSKFARAIINYGVSKRITAGAGLEYFSSLESNKVMPFANISVRIASAMLFSGDFLYGVRGHAVLNYRLKAGLSFDLDYTRYENDQSSIISPFVENRKLGVSMPVPIKRMPLFLRMTLDQYFLPSTKYISTEFLVSGNIMGVSTNITTFTLISGTNRTNINSILSLSYRLPIGLILTIQSQYDYHAKQLNYIKTGLEKNIFRHAVANLSWEENLSSKTRDIQVGLRYDFSFSQSAVNAVIGNKTTTFIESAKGSLMADSHSHFLGVSNTSSVGKGGLVILTFLDMNCNGKYDQDEPKVTGLNLKLQGGRIFTDMKDSIIRVFDLQPFANYFLEFDANSFPNVAWQLRFRSMSTITNPNQFKLIEVPVYVFGEASGMVYTSENVSLQGIGRITVSFFDEKNNCVGKVLTEPDGYYSFLGLPPGTFTVRLDEEQLAKLKLSTAPVSRTITITKSKEGDLAGDLDFILKPGN